MFSVSFTILSHPLELLEFIVELSEKGIVIINSAVFHAGFLTGGKHFDYRMLDETKIENKAYFDWREKFFFLCKKYDVQPAEACFQFALSPPTINKLMSTMPFYLVEIINKILNKYYKNMKK